MTPHLRQQLGDASTFERVAALLGSDYDAVLTSRDVDTICRALDRVGPSTDAKIAILSNYTIDLLGKHIRAESGRLGLAISTYAGPYGQYIQDVLDVNSGLHEFAPDIILLTLTLEQLAPAAYYDFARLSASERAEEVVNIHQTIDSWIDAAKQQTDALLVLCNFVGPTEKCLGIGDSKESYSQAEFYADLNLGLIRAYRQDSRIHVLDLNSAVARYGSNRAFSPRLYYLAKMPWSAGFLSYFAAEVCKYLVVMTGRTAKCLVLDLDNTLWGGVVGEDGPENVLIGKGDPTAESYLSFQYRLRALKERGIILAICSKNNEADIRELFELRSDMPLGLEDFSAKQINWRNKHENIIQIAADLNIGTDSIVFIDDDPVECALVKNMLPEVRTVALPADPAEYVESFNRIPYFEKFCITEEDRGKTVQYRDNVRRHEARKSLGDLNAVLESLATTIRIFPAEPSHEKRIYQLFNKTNQFNVTTKRYAPAEIESFLHKSDYDLWLADVSDRYGDLGIVGLYLLQTTTGTACIDSFVLSCRAMGRGIETAIMNKIKQDYLFGQRIDCLEAEFIRTTKNEPASSFYVNQGFDVLDGATSEHQTYRLRLESAALLPCPGIELR